MHPPRAGITQGEMTLSKLRELEEGPCTALLPCLRPRAPADAGPSGGRGEWLSWSWGCWEKLEAGIRGVLCCPQRAEVTAGVAVGTPAAASIWGNFCASKHRDACPAPPRGVSLAAPRGSAGGGQGLWEPEGLGSVKQFQAKCPSLLIPSTSCLEPSIAPQPGPPGVPPGPQHIPPGAAPGPLPDHLFPAFCCPRPSPCDLGQVTLDKPILPGTPGAQILVWGVSLRLSRGTGAHSGHRAGGHRQERAQRCGSHSESQQPPPHESPHPPGEPLAPGTDAVLVPT